MNLENGGSDTVIILVGINDLLNGSNESQIDSLLQNIGTIIEKCQFYGIKSIFISDLVYATSVRLSILEETYKKFEALFVIASLSQQRSILIDNRNIRCRHLYRDRVHLLESGKRILANIYITFLNKNVLGRTHHPDKLCKTPSILSNLKLKSFNRLLIGHFTRQI